MELTLGGNIKKEISTEKKSLFSLKLDSSNKNNEEISQDLNNPFKNNSNSGGYNFGSNPLIEESQMVNSLLSDTNVPLNVKKKHWWVFSRDISLTFLDEKRKKDKLINFDITKIDTLNALPYYDYTFDTEKEINILRNVYETKLDRALGTTKATQLNERIVQKSQFSEQRQISKDESSNANAGFISKLLNRR